MDPRALVTCSIVANRTLKCSVPFLAWWIADPDRKDPSPLIATYITGVGMGIALLGDTWLRRYLDQRAAKKARHDQEKGNAAEALDGDGDGIPLDIIGAAAPVDDGDGAGQGGVGMAPEVQPHVMWQEKIDQMEEKLNTFQQRNIEDLENLVNNFSERLKILATQQEKIGILQTSVRNVEKVSKEIPTYQHKVDTLQPVVDAIIKDIEKVQSFGYQLEAVGKRLDGPDGVMRRLDALTARAVSVEQGVLSVEGMWADHIELKKNVGTLIIDRPIILAKIASLEEYLAKDPVKKLPESPVSE